MTTALPIHGVDISHYQNGKIDWSAAKKAGVQFVYHKATEGKTTVDENYTKRRAEAKAAGVPFGAYHFARPDLVDTDALAEANHFLDHSTPVLGDLVPVLDLETTGGLSPSQLQTWAVIFSNKVYQKTGFYPMIYGPYEFPKSALPGLRWVPRYNNTNTPPTQGIVDVWQFSNGVYGNPHTVPGFGNVDINTFRGATTLSSLVMKAPTPPHPAKDKTRIKFAHASLQFSDTNVQHTADTEKLFKQGFDVITGTESGPGAGNQSDELIRCAKKYGYHLSITTRYDTWVAVKSVLVKRGWKADSRFAFWRSSKWSPKPPGRWGDKGIVTAQWSMGTTFGKIAVGSVHPLTRRGAGEAVKAQTDETYTELMGAWASEMFAAGYFPFIAGDFNASDRMIDLFLGNAKMITVFDELKKYLPTHERGVMLDSIARYKNPRVKFVSVNVLDDKKFFLNTDHYVVVAVAEITAL